jgi:VCBS repeat-containing protein
VAAATPGVEGTAIALGTLAAAVTSHAGDTNTLNTLMISGAPSGTVLSDGHGHSVTSDGSTPIDVSSWTLSTLAITPTGDANFTLTATATEKDADGDISTTATATEHVIINPTAPTLTWAEATPGVEGTPIALGDLSVAIPENFTNEVTINSLGAVTGSSLTVGTSSLAIDNNTLNTLTISGAPSGTVLSDGHGHSATSDGSTPIDVANWNLSTLTVTPTGDTNFTLTATATVKDADGDVSTAATATEQVIVNPAPPTVTWAAATPGVEGKAIALGTLAATITGQDGDNDTLNTLTISGAPSGAVLSDGHGHTATSDGSTPVDVAGWHLSTLTITPTGDDNFILTATATEKDADGDISTTATATEQVTVGPTAPTVTWAAATPGVEGTPIALGTLAATITGQEGDTNSLNTLTISGAPSGAALSDGHGHTATSDGSTPIDVAGWHLSTLTITPTGDGNFILTATATEKDANGDVSAAATATEQVTIGPTPPTVTWAAATPGVEGTPIALGTLAATITGQDGDTNTLNTLTISGAPSGAVLSDGHGHSVTSDGSTPIDVAAWHLSTLTIAPTGDANFTLTATATEKDANGDISTTATATEQVTVNPTPPTVTWAAATPGVEGTAIALGTLAATITGQAGDTNALNTLTIGGAPSGAVLTDGHGHSVTSDGSTPIDVVGWHLSTLTITPTNAVDFTLTATATEKDANGDISTAATATEQVTVNPTAPTLTTAPVTGVEDGPIALSIAASASGLPGDGNTLQSLVISAIPVGAVLNDGHGHSFTATNATTSVDVLGWTLSGVTIDTSNAQGGDEANFTLQVTATEKDADGNTSSATASETVTVTPEEPSISASPATGVEGSPIALHISASGDERGDSLASLVIGAIPVGDTLSDGHGHSFTATAGHTSVDIHTWNVSTLTITPTTAVDFTLTVTATVQDFEGDVGPSATATAKVTVSPTAPTVTTAPVSGIEDGPIALSVSASANGLPGDSNTVQSLVISAIPVGAVLSDGHGHSFTATNATTSVDVLGWTLSGLTINTSNVPGNDEANFTLQVTATEKDADGNTSSTIASESVTVIPGAPSLSASPDAGVAGSPTALHISASGDDPGESLASLVIGAIPIGDTLSDGHGHTFTATAGQTSVDVHTWNVSTLTVTPTNTVDFTLTVAATVKDFEGDIGPSATTTAHVTVNDPPYVTGTTATGSVPAGLLTPTAATYLTDNNNLVNGLGGTSGFGTSIGRNDDGSSSSLDITSVFGSAGLNFFGHTYTHIYVNNNGNITFTGPNGTYTPGQITAGSNPIIAPFWADVDTRGGTTAPSPGGDSTGSNLVYYSLDSTNHVLTVTWDDVGYYSGHTNLTDAFQLQLIGLGNGNFDIVFRYESIDWTTGDASGGHNGLGGSIARAGYSAGDGDPAHYFELAGSGNQTSMLNLESTTGNTGIAGVDVFQVMSGQVTNAPIASGTIAFADPDDSSHTASVQPEGAGYKGSFTLDPITESNGAGSVAWHFSLTSTEINAITPGTPLVQSYDVAINDGHPGGQVTQTVSVMVGSGGNDTLTGDHGVDVMIGGGGNDMFVFSSHIGQQTVVDFQSGADKIDITQVSGVTADNFASWLNGGNGSVAHATQVGNDTLIDLDQTPHGTDTVLLKNIALSNLHASDFIVHPGGGSV